MKLKNRKYIFLIIILIAILAYLYMFSAQKMNQLSNFYNRKIQQEEVKYLIGVSQVNMTESWRVEMNKEIKYESSKYDSLRVVFTNAGQDSQKQIKDVENLLKLGIDLLIISPSELNIVDSVISKANKIIPVIILHRELNSDDYTLFIGADNKQIGYDAGEYMLEIIKDNYANVLEIMGDMESIRSRQRSQGFRESLEGNKRVKIFDTIEGDWLRDKTEDIILETINGLPPIDFVFAHNDEMAFGAYTAAKKMRINGIEFVGVGGLDGKEGGIQLVKNGILDCTFTNTLGGDEAVKYAMKILRDEKNIPKKIILESQKVTKKSLMKR